MTTTYDAVGQPRTVVDATGWYTMIWNARGEKIADQAPQHPSGSFLTHGYDAVGNRTLVYSWLGLQTMVFDPINRPSVMWDPANRRTTWQYDARDLMTRQENWNGTVTTVAFDVRGLFSGIRHTKSDGNVIEEAYYVRNEVGAPTKRTEAGGALTTWVYDEAGQLRSEWRRDGAIATMYYDLGGNRTLMAERLVGGTPQLTTSTYDLAGQLATERENARILSYTFDANGNQRAIETNDAGITTYT